MNLEVWSQPAQWTLKPQKYIFIKQQFEVICKQKKFY